MFINLSEKNSGESSRNFIYRMLRENILNLYLAPGQGISESDFTSIFGVSRTPIRESFIKLSEEHLVDIFPQKGTFVTPIDMSLADEGIFMRSHLEKAVLLESTEKFSKEYLVELKKIYSFQKSLFEIEYSAAEFLKLDNKFHKLIFAGCMKERIWDKIDSLNTHYNRLRMLDLSEKINVDKILAQHLQLIKVIENHKKDEVINLVDTHLTNIIGKMGTLINKFPNYFIKYEKNQVVAK
jgi:DNA-binding GntR family transcriptional regulator